MTFLVVGSGVLGLAAAEAASRRGERVVVLQSRAWPPASAAAAANLATKAQRFARDPHFALKLEAKARYPRWLEAAGVSARLFARGDGLDVFESEVAAKLQTLRVTQPAIELAARSLEPQEILREGSYAVRYGGEAVVDALALLSGLEATCCMRGVSFVESTVREWGDLTAHSPRTVVLCTGAGTPEFLRALELAPAQDAAGCAAKKRLAAARFSAGSTLVLPEGVGFPVVLPYASERDAARCQSPILLSVERGKHLATFSAPGGRTHVSSSTVRVADPAAPTANETALWEEEDASLAACVPFATRAFEVRKGTRVAFGRGEILVCELFRSRLQIKGCHSLQPRIFLCAGAHKSGYLFAPVLEDLLVGQGAL